MLLSQTDKTMAKNIYHKHTSSNSYWDNSWTDEDYLLCETEEEYNELFAQYTKKAEDYQNSENGKYYGTWRITCSKEQEEEASEYYYAHEWQGKTFKAIGFTYAERLERSNIYKHILKPNSVTGLKECTDRGCGWMYGS